MASLPWGEGSKRISRKSPPNRTSNISDGFWYMDKSLHGVSREVNPLILLVGKRRLGRTWRVLGWVGGPDYADPQVLDGTGNDY